ncbi:MAG: 1,4-alpha-glucan branching protein GlgB [Planctomycetota bacterium]|nr:1,4-alpha-glucan branching protein GlgB [Planctomycetota bacterium]
MQDPHSFLSHFTDLDLQEFSDGTCPRAYQKQGAHIRELQGVAGVNFAVWAPHAKTVSVVGDFNGWNASQNVMRPLAASGIWELFIPDIAPGARYKYRVVQAGLQHVDKIDPYGFACDAPPNNSSIVTDLGLYRWQDSDWMEKRRNQNPLDQPISVYEVHLGSWRRSQSGEGGWKNYRELAHELVEYCKAQNFTHIELMPIAEHPFTGSWGYQCVGYFAPTNRYGRPEDFMYFVDYFHQQGLGVILDWVPAHFPKDEFGLARYDGTPLYEHENPLKGEHPDWGTLIFNYGRNEVKNFLLSNALFWFDQFHVDGLRVDAVASMIYLDYSRKAGQWIPNQYGGKENLEALSFLKQVNDVCQQEYPGIMTIAEESTSFAGVSRPTQRGGLGFSMKWNMGWMNDLLRYMPQEANQRECRHDELTFSLSYAFAENFMLPLSHDEVVHGKKSMLDRMPGDPEHKFANLRLLYSYMWSHPGKKLLFMGNEIGQWLEFNHDGQLQWELLQEENHRGLQKLISDLNGLYSTEPALYELDFNTSGFEWIDCQSPQESLLCFARLSGNEKDVILAVCNFKAVLHEGYRLGVRHSGIYREIFNSDSEYYGGANVGNPGLRKSEKIPAHGRKESIGITVPPLAVTLFKLEIEP